MLLRQGCRDETKKVDNKLAQSEAEELYMAGEARWGTDESTIIRILATRNDSQLRQTFVYYEQVSITSNNVSTITTSMRAIQISC